jgi:hypothetical protein
MATPNDKKSLAAQTARGGAVDARDYPLIGDINMSPFLFQSHLLFAVFLV